MEKRFHLLPILALVFPFFMAQPMQAQWVAQGRIVHPEQILFDYVPSAADQKNLFESKYTQASPKQRDYLLRRLKPENRAFDKFKEREYFTTEYLEDWNKLVCKVMRVFKSEKSKELLALVMIAAGDNVKLGSHKSYYFSMESDEYFVMPITAFESYEWPNGKLPSADKKENELDELQIMAANRPYKHQQRWLNGGQQLFDPLVDMSAQTRQNLLQALEGDEDLLEEIVEMSRPENMLANNHSNYSLKVNTNNSRYNLIMFHLAEFEDDKGKAYEILYCPWDMNDTVKLLSDYRGSTNFRDFYVFAESEKMSDLSFGSDLGSVLARLIRMSPEGFGSLKEELRGQYRSFNSEVPYMGSLTAKGYPLAFITRQLDNYMLSNGFVSEEGVAEQQFQQAVEDLRSVDIPKYGKLTKLEEESNGVGGDKSAKAAYFELASASNIGISVVKRQLKQDTWLVTLMLSKLN